MGVNIKLDSGRHVKHVDRKQLYTDLEARINYLHAFLDFNSSKHIHYYIVSYGHCAENS